MYCLKIKTHQPWVVHVTRLYYSLDYTDYTIARWRPAVCGWNIVNNDEDKSDCQYHETNNKLAP